jgi:hypothetical protein
MRNGDHGEIQTGSGFLQGLLEFAIGIGTLGIWLSVLLGSVVLTSVVYFGVNRGLSLLVPVVGFFVWRLVSPPPCRGLLNGIIAIGGFMWMIMLFVMQVFTVITGWVR